MRLVHKVIVLTVIFFLYLSFLPISFLGKNFNISNVSTYNPHPNISVTNDSELEAVASSGDGSDSNPYIIENLNITTSTNHGIFITGITKYVIIRGCWIDTGGITGFHGIYINSVYNMS